MRNARTWLLRAALLALPALLLAAGGAAAYTANVSPAGSFRMVSSGKVTFSAEPITVTCDMTLRGTLLSRVANMESEGVRGGEITEGAASNCTGGSFRTFLALPHSIGMTFLGIFPENLTGVLWIFSSHAIQLSFTVMGFGSTCLYIGGVGVLWPVSARENFEISGPARALAGTRYSYVSGIGFGCPSTITERSTWELQPLQRITIS